jgi:3-isopropylmalate dehydratase small subunit
MTAGRAFVFGDDINTDALAPGMYMKSPIEVIARIASKRSTGFRRAVKPGDVVVAGRNSGIGSSREQAAEALKHLGVACVVAKSFGGIFYRNALNLGLPVIVCADTDRIRDRRSGDGRAAHRRDRRRDHGPTPAGAAAAGFSARHAGRRRPGAASGKSGSRRSERRRSA